MTTARRSLVALFAGALTLPLASHAQSVVGVRHVALGRSHACAVTSAGETRCWRWPSLASEDTVLRVDAEPIAGLPALDSIVAGNNHTCGLSRGEVWCWGSNRLGQLGRWSRDSAARAIRLTGDRKVVFSSVSAGASHTCALDITGDAWCWGDQWDGSTGTQRTGETVRVPSRVLSKSRFVALTAGGRQSCAVTAGGATVCWGDNATRAVRPDAWRTYFAPVEVAVGQGARSVYTGEAGSCALRADRTTECWGTLATATHRRVAGRPFLQLAIGPSGACGVSSPTGEIACWSSDSARVAYPVTDARGATLRLRELVANGTRACGRSDDESLWCWSDSDGRAVRVILARAN